MKKQKSQQMPHGIFIFYTILHIFSHMYALEILWYKNQMKLLPLPPAGS